LKAAGEPMLATTAVAVMSPTPGNLGHCLARTTLAKLLSEATLDCPDVGLQLASPMRASG